MKTDDGARKSECETCGSLMSQISLSGDWFCPNKSCTAWGMLLTGVAERGEVGSVGQGEPRRIFCGMCGDTGLQNGVKCPQIGCRKANGLSPFEAQPEAGAVTHPEEGVTMITNDGAERESYVLADEVAKVQREREHFKKALEQILKQSACNLARRVAERALQGKKAGF
jgi:hypothetical protein